MSSDVARVEAVSHDATEYTMYNVICDQCAYISTYYYEAGALAEAREHDEERHADDVIAEFPILAGVTDEMVETGARALHDRYNIERGGLRQFDELPPTAQELLRGDARTVLEAAIGKEQDSGQ